MDIDNKDKVKLIALGIFAVIFWLFIYPNL